MLRGAVVKAEYKDTGVSIYQGNPYIEALPPIRSRAEVTAALSRHPQAAPPARPELLAHELKVFNLVQVVLPPHLAIEERLSTCVRAGYLHRNPLDKGYLRRLADAVDDIIEDRDPAVDDIIEDRSPPTTAHKETGFSITGPSGSGKTTGVESALLQLPQVIHHNQYGDEALIQKQLVWVKVDCPHDGSIRGLIREFFRAVDYALGTTYETTYMRPTRNIDELAGDMANVAGLQGMGALVVDEVQNLSEVKTSGHRNLLRFFVQLENMLGIPVVLVGTPRTYDLLAKEFRMLRRFSSEGNVLFDRMKSKEVWDLFFSQIQDYQLLAQRVPESEMPAISQALYDASQGILAIAIRAYCFAHLIARDRGQEMLSPDLFGLAIKESMPYLTTTLGVLRNGMENETNDLDDIKLLDIAAMLDASRKVISVSELQALLGSGSRTEPSKTQTKSSEAPSKDPDNSSPPTHPGVSDLEALGLLRGGDEFTS